MLLKPCASSLQHGAQRRSIRKDYVCVGGPPDLLKLDVRDAFIGQSVKGSSQARTRVAAIGSLERPENKVVHLLLIGGDEIHVLDEVEGE